MPKSCLVLQVLGNSDVQSSYRGADYDLGSSLLGSLGGYSLSELKEAQKFIQEDAIAGDCRIAFPLIQKVQAYLEQEQHYQVTWGIILTNQVAWMDNQDQTDDQGWREIVASDGFWWREILEHWLNHQNYNYELIDLSVDQNICDGVADWDGMAEKIAPLLKTKIRFHKQRIYLNNPNQAEQEFDKIFIQHSSGTPALSSALHLWGIEQKLEGHAVEFVYLSIKESRHKIDQFIHQGQHWQWRLKRPQVLKLLELQDFYGALNLLGRDLPDENLSEQLKYLDRAAAFNLQDQNLLPKQDVIERIAIALWTEKALRNNNQWMNWYLRVAGAMELAVMCLVEKQGHDFTWQPGGFKSKLHHPNNPKPDRGFTVGIQSVVADLLVSGRVEQWDKQKSTNVEFIVTPIFGNQNTPEKWQKFVGFYYGDKWKLADRAFDSFLYVRNNLYHSLSGDQLDKLLDNQTQVLKSAEHPEHPAYIAVGYLRYLVELAGLKDSINERVDHYRNLEKQVKTALEELV